MFQRLVLPSRGLSIADRVTFAISMRERVRGLLGTGSLEPGRALVLPARQVHTLGMRYPIDVVFCTGEWEVVYVVGAMPPNRVTRVVLRARWAVELPAGAARGIVPGDLLSLETAGES